MISFVNGGQRNIAAADSLKRNLLKIKDQYTGTAYLGFALSELDNERVIADALIVTKEKGILAIHFGTGDISYDEEQTDRIFILLRNLLEKNQGLRKRKELAIPIYNITYCIDLSDSLEDFVDENSFLNYFENLEAFEDKYFESLNESLDKIVSAKPKKLRNNVKTDYSLGFKIKEIEKQIANMDEWQKAAAYEVPDRPQRIRGLAGSGKTVVLALKAAYLHFLNPNEDIAVTFYSRSLYEQYEKLISEFYMQYSGGLQVDYEKVHLLHAWGTEKEPGLYSETADRLNETIYTYNEASMRYGREKAFEGICKDLLAKMDLKSVQNIKMYDHILIDEAQDLPPCFFRIAFRLFKDVSKKRLVYAYDELQNLNQSSMPSLADMFGVDEDGNALVEIGNDDEDHPKTDILLPICYRNTKWALSIAHALGFGIYRKSKKQPLVQFFADLDVWEQIGYKVVSGKLEFNKHVKLMRKATPEYFEKLIKPEDAVVVQPGFESKEQEYTWIAKEIKKNIEQDELDPDDILVIFPNALDAKKHYALSTQILRNVGIKSIMPGVNVDRDTFSQQGSITCTHIYRAKGNEKPMVYLADAEYGCLQSEIVQARNVLFTAITRSRAWIKITGIGNGMEQIRQEIRECINNDYALEIDIPSEDEIKELNLLNRENSEKLGKITKNVEKTTEELIKLLKSETVDIDDIPQLQDLAKLLKNKRI